MAVGVMGEMVYNALNSYFHALEVKGYMSFPNMEKLLILIFFKDFVYHDYHGLINLDDYRKIERALDCLYGTTCLIPYPDYMKMGRLYLGNMTELAQRLKTLENAPVLKLIHDLSSAESAPDSDIMVTAEDSE